jgi:peroxin-1
MGRSAVVHFTPLRNCLANLPLSLHGPLNQRGVVRFPPSPAHSTSGYFARDIRSPGTLLNTGTSVNRSTAFVQTQRAAPAGRRGMDRPSGFCRSAGPGCPRVGGTRAGQGRNRPTVCGDAERRIERGIDRAYRSLALPGSCGEPDFCCGVLLQVNIELLRDLPHANAVNVTPSTADDWEILVRALCVLSLVLPLSDFGSLGRRRKRTPSSSRCTS